ncbi:MAG: coenzyme F420 hydrogenase [Planctomycetota bacterium]|nr:MAG: coenzyme F420 hydrogenase [Planctomycetota bacterium]
MHRVDEVAAWQLCCGCGACAYVCPDEIEMIDTSEYGRRPRFKNNSLGKTALLAMQVCPGIGLERVVKPDDQFGGQQFFDEWGPVLGVWEGHAADSEVRFEGSSGGAATALGLFALERLGMHGVLHVQSRQDVPYLNQTVLSRTRSELLAGAGSRYAPASPCDGLQQIEDAPGPCVFVGKPCDVVALRKAIELRPSLHEKVGLTIAFFCAGTPSTRGTLEMIRQMGIADLSSVISLRYRGRGWPGMATAQHKVNGQVQSAELTYEQSWGDILQKYRQWRCYICPDHVGEFADIAVADAWHCPVGEHQPGRSVIIARTQRGVEFLQRAIEMDVLQAEPVDSDILQACRPGQAESKGTLWGRLVALRTCAIPTPGYCGFDLFHLWLWRLSIGAKVKSILSTFKRIYIKKLFRKRNMASIESAMVLKAGR